ncbi:serine/threonine-protein kinase [Sulfurimonas sp.]
MKNKMVLNNRYTLGNKIGEGGLSEVYEAVDLYSQYFKDTRDLVIKLPLQKIATKKDIAAFVYSEYSLLNMLKSENIVKVVDFGIDDNSEIAYLVMQRLTGKLLVKIPLHSINKKMKNNIALSLYKAITYIHNKGIIHADINPTNIMVAPDGFSQLFDFGISQNIEKKNAFNLDFKKINAYNPRYTAPEIFEGEAPCVKTDIFSLACVLFELYTDELPFKNSSVELKDKSIDFKLLYKIPFLERSWFLKTLNYNANLREEKIPFFISLKLWFLNCKKI